MDIIKEEESLTCAYCQSKFKNGAELPKHIDLELNPVLFWIESILKWVFLIIDISYSKWVFDFCMTILGLFI